MDKEKGDVLSERLQPVLGVAAVKEITTKEEHSMSNLAEEFCRQQERCRELLTVYKQIPTGSFGAMMLEDILRRADRAAMEQDPVAMLQICEEMQRCE